MEYMTRRVTVWVRPIYVTGLLQLVSMQWLGTRQLNLSMQWLGTRRLSLALPFLTIHGKRISRKGEPSDFLQLSQLYTGFHDEEAINSLRKLHELVFFLTEEQNIRSYPLHSCMEHIPGVHICQNKAPKKSPPNRSSSSSCAQIFHQWYFRLFTSRGKTINMCWMKVTRPIKPVTWGLLA